MDQHKGFWERLAHQADLPGVSFPGEPVIEWIGDRRVLIENHNGVTEYGCERICVHLRCGYLTVCGFGLELSRVTKELLVITGTVNSLSLQRRVRP